MSATRDKSVGSVTLWFFVLLFENYTAKLHYCRLGDETNVDYQNMISFPSLAFLQNTFRILFSEE